LVNFCSRLYHSLTFQSAIETFVIITIYSQTDPLLTFNHATLMKTFNGKFKYWLAQRDYMRACHKSFGWSRVRNMPSTHEHFPCMLASEVQSTSPQAYKLQVKPTETTGDAGNAPCCYVHIPGTTVKSSHSCIKFLFRNRANLKLWTLIPGLLCKVPEGFLKIIFSCSTTYIQFLFNEYLTIWFSSFLPVITLPVVIYLWM
jgi:hypothetical protein